MKWTKQEFLLSTLTKQTQGVDHQLAGFLRMKFRGTHSIELSENSAEIFRIIESNIERYISDWLLILVNQFDRLSQLKRVNKISNIQIGDSPNFFVQ